ncbi:MAG: sigma-70 family RNA polymerase sigma factor [Acidimicrobiales bacterium]|nr:sigma-70 family RNA polymerase sigma factor [Acidimicrobiales bacterium]
MPDSLEDTLTTQAQAGDRHAFAQLLRMHDQRMRALAYRLLQSAAAMDDALQDAYLKAFRGLRDFRAESTFGTWLYRIVYTTCIDHHRRIGRRAEVPIETVVAELTATAAGGPAFDERVVANEVILAALDRLPPDQCAAVMLVDGDGYSYDDAAYLLDTTAGTIASRLSRARASIRAELENVR